MTSQTKRSILAHQNVTGQEAIRKNHTEDVLKDVEPSLQCTALGVAETSLSGVGVSAMENAQK